jgi:hypothetical protein
MRAIVVADGWRSLSGQLAHFRLSWAMKARPAGPGGASFRKQIRERLAHDGLSAAQLATGGREASLVHRRDEGSKLIQRNSVKHIPSS